jgi:hypothetical protein
MKDRFARHYAKALALHPNHDLGKLQTMNEVNRQKINAQKLVIARAEVQVELAKQRASALSQLNTHYRESEHKARATLARRIHMHQLKAPVESTRQRVVTQALLNDALKTEAAQHHAKEAQQMLHQTKQQRDQALQALQHSQEELKRLSHVAMHTTAQLSARVHKQMQALSQKMQQRMQEAAREAALEAARRTRQVVGAEAEEQVKAVRAQSRQWMVERSAKAEQRATSAAQAAQHEEMRNIHDEAATLEATTASITAKAADKVTQEEKEVEKAKRKTITERVACLKRLQRVTAKLRARAEKQAASQQATIEKQRQAYKRVLELQAATVRKTAQRETNIDIKESNKAIDEARMANAVLAKAIDAAKSGKDGGNGGVMVTPKSQHRLEEEVRRQIRSISKTRHDLLRAAELHKAKVQVEEEEKDRKSVLKEAKLKRAKIRHEGYNKGMKKVKQAHAAELLHKAQSKNEGAAKAQKQQHDKEARHKKTTTQKEIKGKVREAKKHLAGVKKELQHKLKFTRAKSSDLRAAAKKKAKKAATETAAKEAAAAEAAAAAQANVAAKRRAEKAKAAAEKKAAVEEKAAAVDTAAAYAAMQGKQLQRLRAAKEIGRKEAAQKASVRPSGAWGDDYGEGRWQTTWHSPVGKEQPQQIVYRPSRTSEPSIRRVKETRPAVRQQPKTPKVARIQQAQTPLVVKVERSKVPPPTFAMPPLQSTSHATVKKKMYRLSRAKLHQIERVEHQEIAAAKRHELKKDKGYETAEDKRYKSAKLKFHDVLQKLTMYKKHRAKTLPARPIPKERRETMVGDSMQVMHRTSKRSVVKGVDPSKLVELGATMRHTSTPVPHRSPKSAPTMFMPPAVPNNNGNSGAALIQEMAETKMHTMHSEARKWQEWVPRA